MSMAVRVDSSLGSELTQPWEFTPRGGPVEGARLGRGRVISSSGGGTEATCILLPLTLAARLSSEAGPFVTDMDTHRPRRGRGGGGGPGNRRHRRPESGQPLGTAAWEPVSSCDSRDTRPGAALAGNRREGLLGSVVHLAKVTHPEPPHSEREYSRVRRFRMCHCGGVLHPLQNS